MKFTHIADGNIIAISDYLVTNTIGKAVQYDPQCFSFDRITRTKFGVTSNQLITLCLKRLLHRRSRCQICSESGYLIFGTN